MARVTFGAKKIELGDFDPQTGAISNLATIPVYEESFTLAQTEPQTTDHYEQGKPKSPRLRQYGTTVKEISFQVMDTDPDVLADIIGGTVVTDGGGVKKWSEPQDAEGERIRALKVTLEDDSVITVPRFSYFPRLSLQTSRTGINLIEVGGISTETGVVDVDAFSWEEDGFVEPV